MAVEYFPELRVTKAIRDGLRSDRERYFEVERQVGGKLHIVTSEPKAKVITAIEAILSKHNVGARFKVEEKSVPANWRIIYSAFGKDASNFRSFRVLFR